MENEIFYIKAPLDELGKLVGKLVSCQVPFEFNGGMSIKIEVRPELQKAALNEFAAMRRRCAIGRRVFELEHFPMKEIDKKP